MTFLTIATILNSITPQAFTTETIPWKGIQPDNLEYEVNELILTKDTIQQFDGVVNLKDCYYVFEYAGNLEMDSNNPIEIMIETRAVVENEKLNTYKFNLKQEVFEDSTTYYLQINLKELIGLEYWQPQGSLYTQLGITTKISTETLPTQTNTLFYSQRLDIKFKELDNTDLDEWYNSGYEAGYNVGYNTGQNSITCPGVEQQSVFDLLKSAFLAPVVLFSLELMPGLTLGTILLLPVSIGVLFAIWRLLT